MRKGSQWRKQVRRAVLTHTMEKKSLPKEKREKRNFESLRNGCRLIMFWTLVKIQS